MKKSMLLVILVVVASLALLAAAPGYAKLAKLTIWNRTDDNVYVSLKTGDLNYYLTIGSGDKKVFTVEREEYDVVYWACQGQESGTLDMETNVKLTFTDCSKVYSDDTDTYDWGVDANGIFWVLDDGYGWWQDPVTGEWTSEDVVPAFVITGTDEEREWHMKTPWTPWSTEWANPGEPTMEKIHADFGKGVATPWGVEWRFQY